MYYIWTEVFKSGEKVGASVSAKSYVRKGNAIRAAKKRYGDSSNRENGMSFKWIVSEENPWREKE